jgi:glycerol-3-phosphate dehydrogenase (NAD(P)+)
LAAGLHYGDNFLAALVAAALGELDHFLQAQVAGERQITDSVYAGDLMVTAFSTHSRNRRLGYLLGQGETLETIFQTYHLVPEGYYAVRLLVEQHNVQQPIVRGVYELLYQQAEPAEVFERLLGTLR